MELEEGIIRLLTAALVHQPDMHHNELVARLRLDDHTGSQRHDGHERSGHIVYANGLPDFSDLQVGRRTA